MKQIIVDNQVTSYYITKEGKCFNSKTGKFLKGQYSNSGYLNYNLSLTPNCKKRFYAHRLVAQFYLNQGLLIDQKLTVNHKDGNKLNNNVDNLEIVTYSENLLHAVQMGLKPTKTIYQFDKNLQLVASFKKLQLLSKQYNISSILQELNSDKKRLTYNKYYWSYNPVLTKEDIIEFKNTGKAKVVLQYDLKNNLINTFNSTSEAGRVLFPEFKRASSHIGECCRGRIKTYKGYIWKYKDDIV